METEHYAIKSPEREHCNDRASEAERFNLSVRDRTPTSEHYSVRTPETDRRRQNTTTSERQKQNISASTIYIIRTEHKRQNTCIRRSVTEYQYENTTYLVLERQKQNTRKGTLQCQRTRNRSPASDHRIQRCTSRLSETEHQCQQHCSVSASRSERYRVKGSERVLQESKKKNSLALEVEREKPATETVGPPSRHQERPNTSNKASALIIIINNNNNNNNNNISALI